MAGVQVSLVEGDGWDDGEWVQMKKEVLVANTKRNATINLATGEVTATGDVQDTDIIPYADGGEWRAVVVPQSIASGTPLLSITVDGVPYPYKYRVDDVPTDFDYISGKLHKFTVKVSKKEQTGVEFDVISVAITAWEADNVSHQDDAREYVVVHCPVANQLERIEDLSFMDSSLTGTLQLPEGYRVPKGGNDGLWSTAYVKSSNDSTNCGMYWTLADGETTAWYPAVGYRLNASGALSYVGSSGCFWSASPNPSYDVKDSYDLSFSINGNVSPAGSGYRGRGHSVRCVREE